MNTEAIKQAVAAEIERDAMQLPAVIAATLALTEQQVVEHLPAEMVTLLDSAQYLSILEVLKTWGDILTVIDVEGTIFEIKGPFPRGVNKHGYYNLGDRRTPLGGHIKVDGVSAIALVRKPFHGVETRSIQFFGHQGKPLFKVYIRRNPDKSFVAEQLEAFEGLTRFRQAAAI